MKRIFLITFCLLCALSLFACGKGENGAFLPLSPTNGSTESAPLYPSAGEGLTPSVPPISAPSVPTASAPTVTPTAAPTSTPSIQPPLPSSAPESAPSVIPSAPSVAPNITPSSPAQNGTSAYAVSKVNGLAVRKKASVSAGKLGSLDVGDAVLLLGEENGFYKTVYREQTAYVFASYCTRMEIPLAEKSVEKTIAAGAALLGYPYVWGSQRYHWGNGVLNPDFRQGEFDCSALMQYAFYHGCGALLSLTTRTQVLEGRAVSRENIARGDLLFFTNAARKNKTGVERIGHVALYLGNNYILHTASDHAVIEPVSKARWQYYECARRI